MRASKVGLIGLAGAAYYALRRTGTERRIRQRLADMGGDRDGAGDERRATQQVVSTASQAGSTSQVWPDVAAEFDVDADRVLAERTEQADRPVDESADSAGLVAAERDALTVAGDGDGDHRRRDQTAGEAAQEIAAAQVRSRRDGSSGYDDE